MGLSHAYPLFLDPLHLLDEEVLGLLHGFLELVFEHLARARRYGAGEGPLCGRRKRSGDRGIHRVHVQVLSGPEPLRRDILVEEHPLAGDYPGTAWAGFVDQRGLLAGALDRVADRPTLIEMFHR